MNRCDYAGWLRASKTDPNAVVQIQHVAATMATQLGRPGRSAVRASEDVSNLIDLGFPAIEAVLKEVSHVGRSDVIDDAAQVLGALRAVRDAEGVLRRALATGPEAVRITVARALGTPGASVGWERKALEDAFSTDRDPDVRAQAALSYAAFADCASLPLLESTRAKELIECVQAALNDAIAAVASARRNGASE